MVFTGIFRFCIISGSILLLLLALSPFSSGSYLPSDQSEREWRFRNFLRNDRNGSHYNNVKQLSLKSGLIRKFPDKCERYSESQLLFTLRHCRGGGRQSDPYNYNDFNSNYHPSQSDWQDNDDYADYYDDEDYQYQQQTTNREQNSPSRQRQADSQSFAGAFGALSSLGLGNLTQKSKRVGLALVGLGLLFTMVGVSLFFEKNLLRLGNLMFVSGTVTLIGPAKTIQWFSAKQRLRGTCTLLVGVFFVFSGWPVIGMILELFGFLNLFGNFFPLVFAMLKKLPLVRDFTGSAQPNKNYQPRRSSTYDDDAHSDYDNSWK